MNTLARTIFDSIKPTTYAENASQQQSITTTNSNYQTMTVFCSHQSCSVLHTPREFQIQE